MQSKKHSLFEAVFNVTTGFLLAICTQLIVFPLFDIHIKLIENVQISLIFTGVAIVRNYFVRRFFNRVAAQQYGS